MISTGEEKAIPLCSPYQPNIKLLCSWVHNINNMLNKSCGNFHIMDEHFVCFRASSREYFHRHLYIDNPFTDYMLPIFNHLLTNAFFVTYPTKGAAATPQIVYNKGPMILYLVRMFRSCWSP